MLRENASYQMIAKNRILLSTGLLAHDHPRCKRILLTRPNMLPTGMDPLIEVFVLLEYAANIAWSVVKLASSSNFSSNNENVHNIP